MHVLSLVIQAPGIVRLGVDGKLDLAGDGTPLTGNGLLDTLTNRPNSVEYTGHASTDLTDAEPAVGLAGIVAPVGFSEAGKLVLNPSGVLPHALIDEARGFAYFNTCTVPASIIKVDLATFTRVGAITLNSGEVDLYHSVLDSLNGYAYFGNINLDPGMVTQVDINPARSFAVVDALSFSDTCEADFTTSVFDPIHGFIYFGTAAEPGIIVRIDLEWTSQRSLFLPLVLMNKLLSERYIFHKHVRSIYKINPPHRKPSNPGVGYRPITQDLVRPVLYPIRFNF
jgi:hypothetical protein